MKLAGEFTFKGARQEVWDLLQDPDVLASALPGAKKLEKTKEDHYEATMEVKVGPVKGVFTSTVELSNKVPPESYDMKVEGKGGPGFVKGKATIQLEEKATEETLMKYDAELQVGGKLASVGQRLLDTVGKSMTRQSLEAMNAALEYHMDVDTRAKTVLMPPSQAQFAAGVAKDVTKDSLKNPKVWLAMFVIAAIIGTAIWYFK